MFGSQSLMVFQVKVNTTNSTHVAINCRGSHDEHLCNLGVCNLRIVHLVDKQRSTFSGLPRTNDVNIAWVTKPHSLFCARLASFMLAKENILANMSSLLHFLAPRASILTYQIYACVSRVVVLNLISSTKLDATEMEWMSMVEKGVVQIWPPQHQTNLDTRPKKSLP